jgi:hypothetical protein
MDGNDLVNAGVLGFSGFLVEQMPDTPALPPPSQT